MLGGSIYKSTIRNTSIDDNMFTTGLGLWIMKLFFIPQPSSRRSQIYLFFYFLLAHQVPASNMLRTRLHKSRSSSSELEFDLSNFV